MEDIPKSIVNTKILCYFIWVLCPCFFHHLLLTHIVNDWVLTGVICPLFHHILLIITKIGRIKLIKVWRCARTCIRRDDMSSSL